MFFSGEENYFKLFLKPKTVAHNFLALTKKTIEDKNWKVSVWIPFKRNLINIKYRFPFLKNIQNFQSVMWINEFYSPLMDSMIDCLLFVCLMVIYTSALFYLPLPPTQLPPHNGKCYIMGARIFWGSGVYNGYTILGLYNSIGKIEIFLLRIYFTKHKRDGYYSCYQISIEKSYSVT